MMFNVSVLFFVCVPSMPCLLNLLYPYIRFPVSKTDSSIHTIYKDGPIFSSSVNYFACSCSCVNVNYDGPPKTVPSVLTVQWRVYAISVRTLKTSGFYSRAPMFKQKNV
jgi:hypothetical protein